MRVVTWVVAACLGLHGRGTGRMAPGHVTVARTTFLSLIDAITKVRSIIQLAI